MGDYDPSQHGPNYIVDLKLTLNQTSKQLLDEAKRLHQYELVGHTPPEAELLFLKKACQMVGIFLFVLDLNLLKSNFFFQLGNLWCRSSSSKRS